MWAGEPQGLTNMLKGSLWPLNTNKLWRGGCKGESWKISCQHFILMYFHLCVSWLSLAKLWGKKIIRRMRAHDLGLCFGQFFIWDAICDSISFTCLPNIGQEPVMLQHWRHCDVQPQSLSSGSFPSSWGKRSMTCKFQHTFQMAKC